MSTPSQEPPPPLTATDVAQWLCTMDEHRFTLYLKVGGTQVHVEVFWERAELLQEAMEEIRTISAALREEGQHVRDTSADLRAYSTKLREQSARRRECRALPKGGSAEGRAAESRLLELFKGNIHPSKESP
jgi:hypothetical protein